jgi:hypothetical protein
MGYKCLHFDAFFIIIVGVLTAELYGYGSYNLMLLLAVAAPQHC